MWNCEITFFSHLCIYVCILLLHDFMCFFNNFICNILTWGGSAPLRPPQTPSMGRPPASLTTDLWKHCQQCVNRSEDLVSCCLQHDSTPRIYYYVVGYVIEAWSGVRNSPSYHVNRSEYSSIDGFTCCCPTCLSPMPKLLLIHFFVFFDLWTWSIILKPTLLGTNIF